jgi:hypothetical protein
MIRGETNINARWESDVFALLPDGEVVWAEGTEDYQGFERIIAKLDDGRYLFYSWSYGSCSGCDSWEGKPAEMEQDVKSGAQYFADIDVLRQFIKSTDFDRYHSYSEKTFGQLP